MELAADHPVLVNTRCCTADIFFFSVPGPAESAEPSSQTNRTSRSVNNVRQTPMPCHHCLSARHRGMEEPATNTLLSRNKTIEKPDENIHNQAKAGVEHTANRFSHETNYLHLL